MDTRTIALSGEVGSGKSSVAERLVAALGARRESTGEAQRHIAEQRGVSTLELNRMAETDPTIDEEIDSVFRSLASVAGPLVVDSRLAWHFLPASLKVHLVVDPAEAAARVLRRDGTPAERYASVAEARASITDRAESERHRFVEVYGVDIFHLANYDLVIDTTQASAEEVAVRVVDHLAGPPEGRLTLLLAPSRVEPTGPAAVSDDLVAEVRRHGFANLPPIAVAYGRPTFVVMDGRQRLEAARRAGLDLVPAVLALEEEPVSGR
jgi:CMP/dCMP kinase